MTFLASEKKLQTAWKLTTHALPRLAKSPGLYRSRMYPFCLPLQFASFNLFHEIRDEALDTFSSRGILWHSSALQGLPSNHLCSSQVFAVNLFFPFVHRPEALAALLRPHFPDLARMLPVEDDLYVSFEWIGDYNYLGELPKLGSDRHRGAGNTSIDAAVIYETTDGRRIMLLIETKYSESYGVVVQALSIGRQRPRRLLPRLLLRGQLAHRHYARPQDRDYALRAALSDDAPAALG